MIAKASVEELLALDIAQPPWIIEGLIPGGGWTLMYGHAKSGKSTLAMGIAEWLSKGDPVLGFPNTKEWRVVYVQADVGIVEWRHQIKKLCVTGFGVIGDLMPEDLFKKGGEIAKIIKDFGAEFIVFDSLYRLCNPESDLNTFKGISAIVNQANAVAQGIPYMMIHHARKQSKDSPVDVIQSGAGHHTLTAAASAVMFLESDGIGTKTGKLQYLPRLEEGGEMKLWKDVNGKWLPPIKLQVKDGDGRRRA